MADGPALEQNSELRQQHGAAAPRERATVANQPTDRLSQVLGGPPGAVAIRLVLLSIVVGVLLAVLGLNAGGVIRMLQRYGAELLGNGVAVIDALVRYFLLGAVIVVPIWLIVRLSRLAGRR
jgi:hypothetical protein